MYVKFLQNYLIMPEKIFSSGIEKNKIKLVNKSTAVIGTNIIKVVIFEAWV